MALSATDRERLNSSNPENQQVALGDIIQDLETRLAAAEASVTNYSTGVGITLPTSEPATAGSLWSNTLVVTVSDGA